jgi:RNA polymerase sigma-70 factor (ECF subfamily)
MTTDSELLKRWSNGDAQAGTVLFRRHVRSVYMFFQNKVDNIEDMVQRTFLACVEKAAKIDPSRSFKAYLLGIARYQLLQYFAEYRRGEKLGQIGQLSVEQLGNPSVAVAKHQQQRLLLKGLRRIPLDHQIALELYYWEQLPLADIASILEIPEGTVKSRLHRSRGLLRDAIAGLDAPVLARRSTVDDLELWATRVRGSLFEHSC